MEESTGGGGSSARLHSRFEGLKRLGGNLLTWVAVPLLHVIDSLLPGFDLTVTVQICNLPETTLDSKT